MRFILSLGCAAALVAVAACNRSGEEAPSPGNQQADASNVAANGASSAEIAALMHDRHEHYKAMGKAMKGLGDQLKSDSPLIEDIRRHAALIAHYAPQIPVGFPHAAERRPAGRRGPRPRSGPTPTPSTNGLWHSDRGGAISTAPPRPATSTPSAPVRANSARPARIVTTASAGPSTSTAIEDQGLGPADAALPLAAGRADRRGLVDRRE